jgi:hypothetical protein
MAGFASSDTALSSGIVSVAASPSRRTDTVRSVT